MASMQSSSFNRLIAISNRTAAGEESKAGGLAVALWDGLVESKGLWIGWTGRIFDYPTTRLRRSEEEGVEFALLDMTKTEYEQYYLGYSNSVLWPVMHNRLDLAQFDSAFFETYFEINKRFANAALSEAGPDDLIWVHDYHFMLLVKCMKAKGWSGRSGFFLHIPFPAPEIFRAIPDHKRLVEGLCAHDVVGVQTQNDHANLSQYLVSELGAAVLDTEHYQLGDHIVRIRHCPIGIDADGFSLVATEPPALEAKKRLERFLGRRDLVIGVDRMDYSKGLPQRFEGMATLFDQNPHLHGTISFTQIAPPSRSVVGEYAQLRQQLDELSGRINGDYGDLDWIPIRYLARGYPREEVAGLYRAAKAALVTPLQDGMNLVAKEYVAAQDPEDPGVLILSQFAGAAEQMTEALIINPHDSEDVANAVIEALEMPLEERKRRWQILYDGITKQSIRWWQQRFLGSFEPRAPEGQPK